MSTDEMDVNDNEMNVRCAWSVSTSDINPQKIVVNTEYGGNDKSAFKTSNAISTRSP